MPTILRYLSVSLASALVAAYTALWLAYPAPLEQPHAVVRPPLIIQQQGTICCCGVAGIRWPVTSRPG